MRPAATRVLLLDSDHSLLQALSRLLGASEPDWEIVTAFDGQEALELLATQPFAVIITELELPRTDGKRLLQRTAEFHPETVRIVHSSQPATSRAVLRGLAHRVLNKPAAPAHLLTIARWAVRQSRMLARGSGSLVI